MHFHRHPFVHCFFVQHINVTSQSLCRDYGVNSYTAITSRHLLFFVLYRRAGNRPRSILRLCRRLSASTRLGTREQLAVSLSLCCRKTGGRFNFIFCYTFNMLNILKKRIFFAFIFSHLLPVFLLALRPQYPASAFRFRFRPLHSLQCSVSDSARSVRQASRYNLACLGRV